MRSADVGYGAGNEISGANAQGIRHRYEGREAQASDGFQQHFVSRQRRDGSSVVRGAGQPVPGSDCGGISRSVDDLPPIK
ncbi:hypothetical protein D3C77_356570 [compost metagenome]